MRTNTQDFAFYTDPYIQCYAAPNAKCTSSRDGRYRPRSESPASGFGGRSCGSLLAKFTSSPQSDRSKRLI